MKGSTVPAGDGSLGKIARPDVAGQLEDEWQSATHL
jgi:hypothetical protein